MTSGIVLAAAKPQSAAAPSLEQIRNAKASGVHEGAPYVKGGASRPKVELLDRLTATGNLDDRPGEERVAFLAETTGGTGVQVDLAVFGLRDGKVAKLGTVRLGDRVELRGLDIEGNTIVVELVRAGPGDPSCCPTQLARTSYRLGHGGLTSIANEATGTLSLSAIGDIDWTLEELDGQPLGPGGKAPTFRVSGGVASGYGGCNRYTGPVTESAPGNISVGELASTRMACPDAQMSLEDRFLADLKHVTAYAFLEGRLALNWQDGSRDGLLVLRR
jgi:heat shock protein HslJ